jgi:hypothetical protein
VATFERPRFAVGRRARWQAAAVIALAAGGCMQKLDAGWTGPAGPLPVDDRNPIILTNDGVEDNWQGEYAMLLANDRGPRLAGIVISASPPWPNVQTNVAGWRELVAAASASGLRNIPDPITSIGAPLIRPPSGDIDQTSANRSEGALFIIETSRQLSLPHRPLVILTGGRLTDVADAYLVDRTVRDRVVVVSSLGTATPSGGAMGIPNGDMDPWADTIVASRLRYVQVSARYDQLTDVPDARVSELPANPFGDWMAAKQPKIWSVREAADHVALAALALPTFATVVDRLTPGAPVGAGATAGPDLTTDPNGQIWIVRESAAAVATARLWELLLDPTTFAP